MHAGQVRQQRQRHPPPIPHLGIVITSQSCWYTSSRRAMYIQFGLLSILKMSRAG